MKRNNRQFYIMVDFCNNTSLNNKLSIMNMIDELDVNDRVGKLAIKLGYNNPVDSSLIRMISDRFTNLYYVHIKDQNDMIENTIHNQFVLLIKKKTLLRFKLKLQNNNESRKRQKRLIKSYNRCMLYQKYLSELEYYFDRTTKSASTSIHIDDLIDEVDRWY